LALPRKKKHGTKPRNTFCEKNVRQKNDVGKRTKEKEQEKWAKRVDNLRAATRSQSQKQTKEEMKQQETS